MNSVMSWWKAIGKVWQQALILMCAAVLLVSFTYFQTLSDMVAIWVRSETFTHGFLIAPISIWLVWEYRERLMNVTPSADWWYVALIPVFGFLWYAGDIANIQVIKQFSAVAILVTCFAAILGRDVVRAVWFPLLFLLFMVPTGEWLIPPMMEVTATYTVELVKLTGIPVFRDGMHFTLPSGSWSVVEGCSGVRYIIASVTLGVLYAYMTYSSLKKRIIFIVFSLLIPIVANVIRAFSIVMIGHWSGMELATGVDHLIWGWVFFGIVMAILFYLGSLWRDPEDKPYHKVIESRLSTPTSPNVAFYLTSFVFIVIWPIFTSMGFSQLNNHLELENKQPVIQGWQNVAYADSSWNPVTPGSPAVFHHAYKKENTTVMHTVIAYPFETQGNELVASSQRFTDPDGKVRWKIRNTEQMSFSNGTIGIIVIRSFQGSLVVGRLYQVGDTYTTDKLYTKWLQFLNRLLRREQEEAMHYFFMENLALHKQQDREKLVEFIDQYIVSQGK